MLYCSNYGNAIKEEGFDGVIIYNKDDDNTKNGGGGPPGGGSPPGGGGPPHIKVVLRVAFGALCCKVLDPGMDSFEKIKKWGEDVLGERKVNFLKSNWTTLGIMSAMLFVAGNKLSEWVGLKKPDESLESLVKELNTEIKELNTKLDTIQQTQTQAEAKAEERAQRAEARAEARAEEVMQRIINKLPVIVQEFQKSGFLVQLPPAEHQALKTKLQSRPQISRSVNIEPDTFSPEEFNTPEASNTNANIDADIDFEGFDPQLDN